jgi:hypothetical protein
VSAAVELVAALYARLRLARVSARALCGPTTMCETRSNRPDSAAPLHRPSRR